jgi:HPt (histidine-containing phosphotransfer) domain-containing protein
VPDLPPEPAKIDIPGINSRLGLSLYDDDRDMYLFVLRSYADSIPAELDKLRHVSGQSLPDYAIDVHTVKGASAGIGAKSLTEFAKRLELMAKGGDLSGVLSENEQFLREADALIADIRKWLG